MVRAFIVDPLRLEELDLFKVPHLPVIFQNVLNRFIYGFKFATRTDTTHQVLVELLRCEAAEQRGQQGLGIALCHN